MTIGPDGQRFLWGRITEVHQVGKDYQIVEFVGDTGSSARQTLFTPFAGKRDLGRIFQTFDKALLYLVVSSNIGNGTHADHAVEFIWRSLRSG